SCRECPVQIKNLRGSLRCTGGSGRIELSHIDGRNLFVETGEGAISVARIRGKQIYLSRQGEIEGQFLTGKVDFKTHSGKVVLKELAGSVSGRSETSDIQAQISHWNPEEKALVESDSGGISLSFPRDFSSEVDLWSVHGQVK